MSILKIEKALTPVTVWGTVAKYQLLVEVLCLPFFAEPLCVLGPVVSIEDVAMTEADRNFHFMMLVFPWDLRLTEITKHP